MKTKRTTTIGTSSFSTEAAAISYYSAYGYSRRDVLNKIAAGEIQIEPQRIMNNNNYWSLDCDVIQGPKDAGTHFATAATPAIAIRICELLNIEDGPVQVVAPPPQDSDSK